MTMGMNKPHRTFAERSYEPMRPRAVLLAWLAAYAIAGLILFGAAVLR